MRIQMQDRVRAYPRTYIKQVERIEPISPVTKIKQTDDERTFGEAFILSETAELVLKIFILGIAPLYLLWLIVQAFRLLKI